MIRFICKTLNAYWESMRSDLDDVTYISGITLVGVSELLDTEEQQCLWFAIY